MGFIVIKRFFQRVLKFWTHYFIRMLGFWSQVAQMKTWRNGHNKLTIKYVVIIKNECMVNWLWHVWQFLQIFIWAGLFFLGLNCATWDQKSSILVKLSSSSSCFSRLLALLGFWLVQFNLYCTLCAGLWLDIFLFFLYLFVKLLN
jgi:hypothetical protein